MRTKDNEQHEFINRIANYLHMDFNNLKDCVPKELCYENLIYKWAVKLYHKGVHYEDAIQVIFRARLIFLIVRNKFAT